MQDWETLLFKIGFFTDWGEAVSTYSMLMSLVYFVETFCFVSLSRSMSSFDLGLQFGVKDPKVSFWAADLDLEFFCIACWF